MPIYANEQAQNLRNFFAEGINSVTRERIFFSRLSFDLKIAAARAGYHLHLYEPDVDRDGFDIVVEDQEGAIGWFQLKAVLRSAATTSWSSTVGFMRPHIDIGEKFNFSPVECGRGGGVILIEIDDETSAGNVAYSYTDFAILTALAERFLVEEPQAGARARGRPHSSRSSVADRVVKAIRAGKRNDEVVLPEKGFLPMKSPDALLAAMGMWNSQTFGKFSIHQAYDRNARVDAQGNGIVGDDSDLEPLGILKYHMDSLVELIGPSTDLQAFEYVSPHTNCAPSI